jgi:putative peptide zinc metalloprotease protein
MRSIALVAAATLAAFVLASVQPEDARAQDSAAVAVNTKDGTSIFRLAFKVVRVNREVVDNSNVAFSFASCEECEAIALSFMAVLIFSDPDEVLTANQAWAINWECTECLAFAWAVQSVFTTDGPVHFSADGNRRLAELRQELRRLLDNLDAVSLDVVPEKCQLLEGDALRLCVALTRLTGEFREILATELVPAGRPPAETPTDDGGEEPPAEEPSTTETTSTTTETTP